MHRLRIMKQTWVHEHSSFLRGGCQRSSACYVILPGGCFTEPPNTIHFSCLCESCSMQDAGLFHMLTLPVASYCAAVTDVERRSRSKIVFPSMFAIGSSLGDHQGFAIEIFNTKHSQGERKLTRIPGSETSCHVSYSEHNSVKHGDRCPTLTHSSAGNIHLSTNTHCTRSVSRNSHLPNALPRVFSGVIRL